jgi:Domain of unknown function (DUF2703)
MKQLDIECKHYENEGLTCDRCSETGKTLHDVVQKLQLELAGQDVVIILTEVFLNESRIDESNRILINGIALEDILDTTTTSSDCPSCSCLTGKETSCRTVVHEGTSYEEIPEELIRKTVFQVLQLTQT